MKITQTGRKASRILAAEFNPPTAEEAEQRIHNLLTIWRDRQKGIRQWKRRAATNTLVPYGSRGLKPR